MEKNREMIENGTWKEREEYIKLRERVDVAVGLMASGEFIRTEIILRAIGTESALRAAEKLEKKENKKKELDVIKYNGAVSEDA